MRSVPIFHQFIRGSIRPRLTTQTFFAEGGAHQTRRALFTRRCLDGNNLRGFPGSFHYIFPEVTSLAPCDQLVGGVS
jgi:hypothetical protein